MKRSCHAASIFCKLSACLPAWWMHAQICLCSWHCHPLGYEQKSTQSSAHDHTLQDHAALPFHHPCADSATCPHAYCCAHSLYHSLSNVFCPMLNLEEQPKGSSSSVAALQADRQQPLDQQLGELLLDVQAGLAKAVRGAAGPADSLQVCACRGRCGMRALPSQQLHMTLSNSTNTCNCCTRSAGSSQWCAMTRCLWQKLQIDVPLCWCAAGA